MKKEKHKARPQQHERPATQQNITEEEFALGRENYIMIAIGFAIVVLGFILMIGKEDIYDFRKITLAPIVVVSGFAFLIYAIMKRPKH